MSWLTYDKLQHSPYSLENFQIIDNLHKMHPHDQFDKELIPCPSFCHLYHKYWKQAEQLDSCRKEEHEKIKEVFEKITATDPNANSWDHFYMPESEEDRDRVLRILKSAVFSKHDAGIISASLGIQWPVVTEDLSEYIQGYSLGLRGFELVEHVKNGTLIPINNLGNPIPCWHMEHFSAELLELERKRARLLIRDQSAVGDANIQFRRQFEQELMAERDSLITNLVDNIGIGDRTNCETKLKELTLMGRQIHEAHEYSLAEIEELIESYKNKIASLEDNSWKCIELTGSSETDKMLMDCLLSAYYAKEDVARIKTSKLSDAKALGDVEKKTDQPASEDNSRRLPAGRAPTNARGRWDRANCKAQDLLKDDPDITLPEIYKDPLIRLIWPKKKMPTFNTFARNIGHIPGLKTGRRKNK